MKIEEGLKRMGEHKNELEHPSQDEWDRFRTRGHRRLLRRRAFVSLAAAAIVVAGAQGAEVVLRQEAAPLPPADDGTPPVTKNTAQGQIAMQTWYVQGNMLYLDHELVEAALVSETERTPADRATLMKATLERVLRGPSAKSTDPSVRTVLSPGTRLLDLDLGSASSVDLSQLPDGLTREERNLALAQIAATILQYEDIVSVDISEKGSSITNAPLTAASYEDLLAPIVLTEPPRTEQPTSFVGSLTIEGTANVFEATIVYELVDDDGDIISDGFTTATCGTGCRGTFSERVEFDVTKSTVARLNVYAPSAEDGSRMFEVSVPVILCPVQGGAMNTVNDDPYSACGAN